MDSGHILKIEENNELKVESANTDSESFYGDCCNCNHCLHDNESNNLQNRLQNVYRRKSDTFLVIMGSLIGTALIMGSMA